MCVSSVRSTSIVAEVSSRMQRFAGRAITIASSSPLQISLKRDPGQRSESLRRSELSPRPGYLGQSAHSVTPSAFRPFSVLVSRCGSPSDTSQPFFTRGALSTVVFIRAVKSSRIGPC